MRNINFIGGFSVPHKKASYQHLVRAKATLVLTPSLEEVSAPAERGKLWFWIGLCGADGPLFLNRMLVAVKAAGKLLASQESSR